MDPPNVQAFWLAIARREQGKLLETRQALVGWEWFLIGCTAHSAKRAQEVIDNLGRLKIVHRTEDGYQVDGFPLLSEILTWMHREGLFDPAKHPAGR